MPLSARINLHFKSYSPSDSFTKNSVHVKTRCSNKQSNRKSWVNDENSQVYVNLPNNLRMIVNLLSKYYSYQPNTQIWRPSIRICKYSQNFRPKKNIWCVLIFDMIDIGERMLVARYFQHFRNSCSKVIILSKHYYYYVYALGNTKQLSIYGHSWSSFPTDFHYVSVSIFLTHLQTHKHYYRPKKPYILRFDSLQSKTFSMDR